MLAELSEMPTPMELVASLILPERRMSLPLITNEPAAALKLIPLTGNGEGLLKLFTLSRPFVPVNRSESKALGAPLAASDQLVGVAQLESPAPLLSVHVSVAARATAKERSADAVRVIMYL